MANIAWNGPPIQVTTQYPPHQRIMKIIFEDGCEIRSRQGKPPNRRYRYGTFDEDRCVIVENETGATHKSVSSFSMAHLIMINRAIDPLNTKANTCNGWTCCTYKVNGEWVDLPNKEQRDRLLQAETPAAETDEEDTHEEETDEEESHEEETDEEEYVEVEEMDYNGTTYYVDFLENTIYNIDGEEIGKWINGQPRLYILDEAESAKAIVKPCKNSGADGDFQTVLNYCLGDNSIGLHYGVGFDLTGLGNSNQIRRSLDAHWNNTVMISDNHEGWPHRNTPSLLNKFINQLQIGDKIIIGQGARNALYLATISSSYYFDPSQIVGTSLTGLECGFFHRRKLTNITPLPVGTKIAQPCISTIKMRPQQGWGLSQ